MVGGTNFACVAAYLLAAICLHPASAATLLPNPININGTSYSEQVTLSEVGFCKLTLCLHLVSLWHVSHKAVLRMNSTMCSLSTVK